MFSILEYAEEIDVDKYFYDGDKIDSDDWDGGITFTVNPASEYLNSLFTSSCIKINSFSKLF